MKLSCFSSSFSVLFSLDFIFNFLFLKLRFMNSLELDSITFSNDLMMMGINLFPQHIIVRSFYKLSFFLLSFKNHFNLMMKPGNQIFMETDWFLIVHHSSVMKKLDRLIFQWLQNFFCYLSWLKLLMRYHLFFFFDFHLSLFPIDVLLLPQFNNFQLLSFCNFILSHFLIVSLLFPHHS